MSMYDLLHPQQHPEETQIDVPGVVRQPPAPATEVAGPALTDLVVELRRSADALDALWRQARFEALERYYPGVVQDQTDGNGDAALQLFQVPQGATGYLMLCAVDEAGVTPATPDTSATLWHAIYAGPAGDATAAQIAAVGSMLDCAPQSPAVDAQIPFVYLYGDRYGAPALVGPLAFWLVIDAATAARQVAARYGVLVAQPEP